MADEVEFLIDMDEHYEPGEACTSKGKASAKDNGFVIRCTSEQRKKWRAAEAEYDRTRNEIRQMYFAQTGNHL